MRAARPELQAGRRPAGGAALHARAAAALSQPRMNTQPAAVLSAAACGAPLAVLSIKGLPQEQPCRGGTHTCLPYRAGGAQQSAALDC